jgi:hypothetical protein
MASAVNGKRPDVAADLGASDGGCDSPVGLVADVGAASAVVVGLVDMDVGERAPPPGAHAAATKAASIRVAMVRAGNWRALVGIALLITTDDYSSLVFVDRPHPRPAMVRRLVVLLISGSLVVGLASVALAADPNGASGHGAEVSAVAKAVHAVQGNAHGKAVSAIAKAHGKEVSAAARARAAAKQAAKDNGNAGGGSGNEGARADNSKAKANARGHEEDTASLEIGRIKVERTVGS